MKPQIASQFDPSMRYFRQELFLRFNSADEREADRADEAWETAIAEYRVHLDRIRDQLPAHVRKLSELCLHDAELLAYDQVTESILANGPSPARASEIAILSVKKHDQIISLNYLLWDVVREFPAPDSWPFSQSHTHWLYDEIDIVANDPTAFLHRILLSDGRILVIPFSSVFAHQLPLVPPVESVKISPAPKSVTMFTTQKPVGS